MDFKLSDLKYHRDAEKIINTAKDDIKRIAEEHNARGILHSGIFLTTVLKRCIELISTLLHKKVSYDLENIELENKLIKDYELVLYKRHEHLGYKLIDEFALPILSDWATRIGSQEMLGYLYKTLKLETEKIESKAKLDVNIAKIEEATKEKTKMNKLIEIGDYSIISSKELRAQIERDIKELNQAIENSNYKTIIVFSGRIIEAILLDALLQREEEAKKFSTEKDIRKWNLEKIIQVAHDLHLIGTVATNTSHLLRQYRNIIHPGKELRDDYKVVPELATISIQAVSIVISSLHERGVV